jgi:uncharacterized membrane protein
MSVSLVASLAASAVIHEIATLILVGSLFFILFVQLPAISRVKSPRARLRLRRASFKSLFRWGWVGLLLLWLTGGYELLATSPDASALHVRLMAVLSAVFTLLFLLAQFGVLHDAIVALEDGNSERASWLYRRLQTLLAVAFALAVVVMLLDVAGPALAGVEGLTLKSLFSRS